MRIKTKIMVMTWMFCVMLTFSGCMQGNALKTENGLENAIKFTSPYDDIDWDTILPLQFDGHVHARRGSSPGDIVHAFDKMGYDVIAFKDSRTDGRIHYPMEDWGVDMENYNILVIPGQGVLPYSGEAPFAQHMKVWFSEEAIEWREEYSFEESIVKAKQDNGLIVFAHPASEIYPMYPVNVGHEWYVQHYDKYPHILGMEVNNHDTKNSLKLFDELLKHYGSNRLIAGFGSSDTQGLREDGSIGRGGGNFGLSIVFSDGHNSNSFRNAIELGRILWITAPEPDIHAQRIKYPLVEKIDVTDDRITLSVTDHIEIRWIYDNEVIKTGNTFMLEDIIDPAQNYVRFEISGTENTTVGSQAFYISNL